MKIKTEKDTIIDYINDASNYKGNAEAVIIPATSDEIIKILQSKNYKSPITISAARTGLTGAAVPEGGTVISTLNMNRIIKYEPEHNQIVVGPGLRFSELQLYLNEKGFLYPPNPTEIESTIGGNLATNASGARTFKYGATRNWVEGIDVILSNGDQLKLKRGKFKAEGCNLKIESEQGNIYEVNFNDISMPKTKNAAGYYLEPNMDAVDLFIGSEGTLGIITEITLKYIELPEKVIGGMVFFDEFDNILEFVTQLRKVSIERNKLDYKLNKEISCRIIEYFDNNSLEVIRMNNRGIIPMKARYAIWIEQETTENNEIEVLTSWSEYIQEHSPYFEECIIASNTKEHEKLRQLRHSIPLYIIEKVSEKYNLKYKTDTAVPIETFNEHFIKMTEDLEASGRDFINFGHIGNCHIHSNIFTTNDDEQAEAHKLSLEIIERAIEMNGTVSAEHGIGKIKKEYFSKMYDDSVINMMRKIKKVFDPDMVLNKGNIF